MWGGRLMYDVPEIPTEESMKMLSNMTASELYRLLCSGMKAADMAAVDRALNMAAGLGGDARQQRMDFSAGRAALDDEWKREMDLDEYATDNGITEEEALAELQRKAYWA